MVTHMHMLILGNSCSFIFSLMPLSIPNGPIVRCLAQEHLKGEGREETSALLLNFTSCSVYSTRQPCDHRVTSLTVRPLCHMEKYSTRDLKVNTSLVSFCSGQAFNRNSSCASSPLGPGKWKDIIQIIKSVWRGWRGWRIVRNSANITQVKNSLLIESVSVPSSGYYTHLTLCTGENVDSQCEL